MIQDYHVDEGGENHLAKSSAAAVRLDRDNLLADPTIARMIWHTFQSIFTCKTSRFSPARYLGRYELILRLPIDHDHTRYRLPRHVFILPNGSSFEKMF